MVNSTIPRQDPTTPSITSLPLNRSYIHGSNFLSQLPSLISNFTSSGTGPSSMEAPISLFLHQWQDGWVKTGSDWNMPFFYYGSKRSGLNWLAITFFVYLKKNYVQLMHQLWSQKQILKRHARLSTVPHIPFLAKFLYQPFHIKLTQPDPFISTWVKITRLTKMHIYLMTSITRPVSGTEVLLDGNLTKSVAGKYKIGHSQQK